MRAICLVFCLFAALLQPAGAEVLRVGPERILARPSDAARVARDSDVIEIDAGTYKGDAAVWTQDNLIIRGAGGRVRLFANGAHAEGKGIWVVKGANTTISGIEFSGAAVPHRNGAAIRLEGAGLTVRDCYFTGNENGILTGVNLASDILIEHSEFAYNGYGTGYSHNIYIGTARSFTLRYSYVHHAVVGHNVKSRALSNYILYNRIADEAEGRASYAIDLPDGGLAIVLGNVIHQGPATENDALVAYGAEGIKNPVTELYLVHNTLVNELERGGRFVFVRAGTLFALNNVFAGPGVPVSGGGAVVQRDNVSLAASDFVAPERFDYRLKPGSQAIGRAGDTGDAHGFELRPVEEYVHRAIRRPRRSARDAGAYEH